MERTNCNGQRSSSRFIIPILIGLSSLMTSAPMCAATLVVSINNAGFVGEQSVSGSFSYDSSSRTILSSTVTVTAPGLNYTAHLTDVQDSAIIVHSSPVPFVEFVLVAQQPTGSCSTGSQCGTTYASFTVSSLPTAPGSVSLICGLCDGNPSENAYTSSISIVDPPNYLGFALQTAASLTITQAQASPFVSATIPMSQYPWSVVVNPTTNQIYVANNYLQGALTVINGQNNSTAQVSIGSNVKALDINPQTNNVYLPDPQGQNALTIVNGNNNATSTVHLGWSTDEVAVNPQTNKAYFSDLADGSVTVVDGATNSTTRVSVGTSPQAIAVNTTTNKIYVGNLGHQSLTVIDGATNNTSTISLATYPYAIAVNPLTNKIYVANAVRGVGTVKVIDGATGSVTATINVGSVPSSIAVNPVTNTIYVLNIEGTNTSNSGGSKVPGSVTAINGLDNSTVTIPVGQNYVGSFYYEHALAVDPVRNQVYVSNQADNTVTVIQGTTPVATVSVGSFPIAIAVNSITNEIFVVNEQDSTVSVIDGASNAISGQTQTTPGIGSTGNAGSTTANGPSNNITVQVPEAEPVSTGNGNYYYQHTDFSIPSRGLPLAFQRTYNTLDSYTGPLGANWTHALNIALTLTANGVANVRWGDGHGEAYTLTGAIYVPQAGVFNTFTANGNGTFTVKAKSQTKYNFSSSGKLTSVQDKNGNAVTLSYDSSGNLVQVTDAVGRSLTLSYDSGGRITQVTDPISRKVIYVYDGNNNLASVTDAAGGITQYVYDGNHRVVQITLPNGTILLKNAYDGQGRVTSQTNGRGFTWQFAYNTPGTGQTTITDARNNKTVHSYDSSLRIMSIADPLGNTTSYTYDAENDRTGVTNPNGKTTDITYDGNGNITQITDPLHNAVRITYDGNNDLLTLTNPKDQTTNFAYDAHGNLASVTDLDGHVSSTAYDAYGEPTSRTDANSHTTTLAYDSSGDLATVTNALGQVTKLGYDAVSHLVSVTDANGHTTNMSYSALDRITKSTDPLGDATQFTYDAAGNLLKTTDPNNNATGYAYDAASNLVTVTDAKGNLTQYAYDPDNNRIGFMNANDKTTTYAFDAANRLISATDPLSFANSYTYDSAGNVIGVKDANGKTNHFGYDALNRLTAITYSDGTSVGYAFDADGNRLSMTDPHGTTTYAYDDLDRLLSVTKPAGNAVGYSYDATGRRTRLTYADGKIVAYQYDAANRLSTATDWLSRPTTYSYDGGGNLTAVAYPTGAGVSFTYDGANRLTSVANKAITGVFSSTGYTLDAAGNRTAITANGLIRRYGYDVLNQLISQTVGTQVTSWTYDPVGNRLSQVAPTGTTNYSYDAADRLLSAGATTFVYDADGSRISQTNGSTVWSYSYDSANRLSSVIGTGVNNTNSYDGDGNRIAQSTALGNYSYVNDTASSLPVVLNEQGPDGNITFTYGTNLIEEASSSFNYFYGFDGLGSVSGLTDGVTGKAVTAYAYDAWGNSTSNGSVGLKDKFRYTGEALDPGTGLYYMRARYYDSSVGRFLSRDTFSANDMMPISTNGYAYAWSNPIRYVDPSGHDSWEAFWNWCSGFSQTCASVAAASQKATEYNNCTLDIGNSTNGCNNGLSTSIAKANTQVTETGTNFVVSAETNPATYGLPSIPTPWYVTIGKFLWDIFTPSVAHAASTPASK